MLVTLFTSDRPIESAAATGPDKWSGADVALMDRTWALLVCAPRHQPGSWPSPSSPKTARPNPIPPPPSNSRTDGATSNDELLSIPPPIVTVVWLEKSDHDNETSFTLTSYRSRDIDTKMMSSLISPPNGHRLNKDNRCSIKIPVKQSQSRSKQHQSPHQS